jgi:hypothetical protein
MNQFYHITEYWVSEQDEEELSFKAFDVLIQKIKSIENESLRNLLVNNTFNFASSPEQI